MARSRSARRFRRCRRRWCPAKKRREQMQHSRPGETWERPDDFLASRVADGAEPARKAFGRRFLNLYPIWGETSCSKERKIELRLQFFGEGLSKARRRRRDGNSGRFHSGSLGSSIALAAGNDRAGVTHAAAGGRGDASDKADHRFLAAPPGFVLQELRGVLLSGPSDLPDHNDRGGLRVGQKHLQHVDEFGSLDRVAADTDRGGLPKPLLGGLEHGLISQRAGARHDADIAGLENICRHDAYLALASGHDAGTVRPDQPRLRARERALHPDHVEHRNAFGDADDQRNFGIDRLADRIRRAGWRHINHAGIRAGLLARFRDRIEYRQAEMGRTAFAGGSAADHLGAVSNGGFRMERAVLAGKTLADDLVVFVDQDGHGLTPGVCHKLFAVSFFEELIWRQIVVAVCFGVHPSSHLARRIEATFSCPDDNKPLRLSTAINGNVGLRVMKWLQDMRLFAEAAPNLLALGQSLFLRSK